MSAAGRGAARAPFDYYPTPPWVVDRLLDRHGLELLYRDIRILEPTVGDGAIVRAVAAWLERHDPHGIVQPRWTGVELREHALHESTPRLEHHIEGTDIRDFRACGEGYDLALGNPPFGIAEELLRHIFTLASPVCMLLRLGFFGSGQRIPFWQEHSDELQLRILPDRPSFTGDGGSDSSVYAWFCWGADLGGRAIEVLDGTPLNERKAHQPIIRAVIPRLGLFKEG